MSTLAYGCFLMIITVDTEMKKFQRIDSQSKVGITKHKSYSRQTARLKNQLQTLYYSKDRNPPNKLLDLKKQTNKPNASVTVIFKTKHSHSL